MNKEEIENRITGICVEGMLLEKIEPIINQLQQENEKYKEVIEKIKTRYCDYYGTTKEINDDYVLRNVLKEISDILKEVE